MKRVLAAASVALALAVAGCGDSDGGDNGSGGAADTSPAQTTTETSADTARADIEYKLASLDAGTMVDGDDPVLDEYAKALDSLEAKCKEPRSLLGEYAEKAHQLIGDDEPRLSILQHVDKSIPSGAPTTSCSDIFAAYVTLRQGG